MLPPFRKTHLRNWTFLAKFFAHKSLLYIFFTRFQYWIEQCIQLSNICADLGFMPPRSFHWPFAPQNAVRALCCCCVESSKHRKHCVRCFDDVCAMFRRFYAAQTALREAKHPWNFDLGLIWRSTQIPKNQIHHWIQHKILERKCLMK